MSIQKAGFEENKTQDRKAKRKASNIRKRNRAVHTEVSRKREQSIERKNEKEESNQPKERMKKEQFVVFAS